MMKPPGNPVNISPTFRIWLINSKSLSHEMVFKMRFLQWNFLFFSDSNIWLWYWFVWYLFHWIHCLVNKSLNQLTESCRSHPVCSRKSLIRRGEGGLSEWWQVVKCRLIVTPLMSIPVSSPASRNWQTPGYFNFNGTKIIIYIYMLNILWVLDFTKIFL